MTPTQDEPWPAGRHSVKLVDVAAAAEVSVATVSRVLNGNPQVDPELAERVRTAAGRLGYRPNAVARNLRRRHTRVWALVVTDVTNPYYTAVARGVEDVASAAGYSVLLGNSDELPEKEARYLQVAAEERVAGVIIGPCDADSPVAALVASSIPVVAIDRRLRSPVDTVLARSRQGAAQATQHLLDEGWRRPACVSGPEEVETAEDRVAGYRSVVETGGLPDLVARVPFQVDGGRAGAARLLDGPVAPDSFLVANSVLALGVLAELQHRDLRVGTDIGLITFDDAPWASLTTPPTSVVTQPAYQIGVEAGRTLVARLGDPTAATDPRMITFDTELIIRESSRRRSGE